MFRQYINKKINDYIYPVPIYSEKINILKPSFSKNIICLVKTYLCKTDVDQILYEVIKNTEPYEIMDKVFKIGVNINNVYNKLRENIDTIHLIHPDLIPFFINNNIIIDDDVHSKIMTKTWGNNDEMKYALVQNCLEYKITSIYSYIKEALRKGNVFFAQYLLFWNNELLNDYTIYNSIIRSASESWEIDSLVYVLSLHSPHDIDPITITYAAYNSTSHHLYILLQYYLAKGGKKFIIYKKMSDHFLTGLSGINIIHIFKRYDFVVEDYENIM